MQYSPAFTKSKTVKLILPLYEAINKKAYNRIDYFIYITKHMVSLFPPRPYSIMEGLIDVTKEEEETTYEKNEAFTIMYAGGLIEKMGVGAYLDSIAHIHEPQIKFVFYGNGDMLSRIQEKSLSDPRIVYGGVLSHAEVLKKEREANILINPRPIGDDYTYYSFPSKLMEYMHSGTPVLTSRLAGIPDEYKDLMLYIEDSTVDGIAKAINNCLNLSQDSLNKIGVAASDYVKQNKNCLVQIERIINNVIETLFN
jgi:glycosyltransferase involved in cell wall biosynthesis